MTVRFERIREVYTQHFNIRIRLLELFVMTLTAIIILMSFKPNSLVKFTIPIVSIILSILLLGFGILIDANIKPSIKRISIDEFEKKHQFISYKLTSTDIMSVVLFLICIMLLLVAFE